MALALARKQGESILIGKNIRVQVARIGKSQEVIK